MSDPIALYLATRGRVLNEEARAASPQHPTRDAMTAQADLTAPMPHPVEAMLDPAKARTRLAFLDSMVYAHPRFPEQEQHQSVREVMWLIWIEQSKADPGHVYFIKAPDLDRIKVGFTRDVRRRFHTIRNASPCKMELLGSVRGKPALESALLEYLRPHQAYGEWFFAAPAVVEATRIALGYAGSAG